MGEFELGGSGSPLTAMYELQNAVITLIRAKYLQRIAKLNQGGKDSNRLKLHASWQVFPPLTSSLPVRRFPKGLRNKERFIDPLGLATVFPADDPESSAGHGIAMVSIPYDISENNFEVVIDVLASCGQMFNGAHVQVSADDTFFIFPSPANAAKFAMVAQMSLMAANFPDKLGSDHDLGYAADDETTVVFRGVRLGMVVHCGYVQVSKQAAPSFRRTRSRNTMGSARKAVLNKVRRKSAPSFTARGAEFASVKALASTCFPGQVLMTNEAWADVQALPMRSIQVSYLSLNVKTHESHNQCLKCGASKWALLAEFKIFKQIITQAEMLNYSLSCYVYT
eukprot:scaffold208563_cov37-Prasinocladus_malaysianus.AAC.1